MNYRLSPRQVQLLEIIIFNQVKETQKITSELKITPKTLKSDVLKINFIIKKFDSQIIMNNKKCEFKTNKTINWWKNKIYEISDIPVNLKILIYLLILEKPITIQELALKFYISKAQLERVIHQICFVEYKIIKKQKIGIFFNGTIQERFNLLINLINDNIPFNNPIGAMNNLLSSLPVEQKIVDNQSLGELFLNLSEYINESNVQLVDRFLKKLYVAIVILVNFKFSNEDKSTENSKLTQNYPKFQSNYKINNNYLFYELYEQLISAQNKSSQEIKIQFINDLNIIQAKNNFQIDLNDLQIVDMLRHYETLINLIQTRNDIRFRKNNYQNLINNFKVTYGSAYEAGMQLIELIGKRYSINLDPIEAVYFGTYFTKIIKTSVKKPITIKILLVVEHGTGLANFLKERIRTYLKTPIKIDSISVFNYKTANFKNSNYDLIIVNSDSDKSSFFEKTKTIFIDDLLAEQNLQKISQTINQVIYQKIINDQISEYIFFETINNDYFAILNAIKNVVLRKKITNIKYFESLFEREKNLPSNFNLLAIPHGKSEYVYKNAIVFVKVNSQVSWNNQSIKLIAILIVDSKILHDYQSSISLFYTNLLNKEYFEKIKNASNLEEIKKILKGEIYEK